MTSLGEHELRTIYETLCRIEEVKKNPKNLEELFRKDARLIISPNNECYSGCLHCVSNSIPNEKNMPYDKFTQIDPDFFKTFKIVDFGRKGNPLIYHSSGYDLVDLIDFLNKKGMPEFTLAVSIQKKDSPIIEKLEEFSLKNNFNIKTMLTYHHYFDNLNTAELAQDFNFSLKNILKFSKRITISLLGDKYSQKNPSMAEEVEETFRENWKIIFDEISLKKTKDNKEYKTKSKNGAVEIFIPEIDTLVYPLGRFRKYLSKKGILKEYEEKFEQSLSDYACPDLITWPGIIIEPDGSLNLCASFEAVNCKKAIVSNIFTKPFSQVKKDLIEFHKREFNWFIKNLDDIVNGKGSTCKLKNNCYKN